MTLNGWRDFLGRSKMHMCVHISTHVALAIADIQISYMSYMSYMRIELQGIPMTEPHAPGFRQAGAGRGCANCCPASGR